MISRILARAATPLERLFRRNLHTGGVVSESVSESVAAFNAELERVFGGSGADVDGGDGGATPFSPPRLTAAGAPPAFEGALCAPAREGAGSAGVNALAGALDETPLELFLLLVAKGALDWPSGRLLRAVELSPHEVARVGGVTTSLIRRLHAAGVLA